MAEIEQINIVTITFSGNQGSGKTILSNLLKDYLGSLGYKVHKFDEPTSLKVTTTKKLLARAKGILPK